MDTRIIKINKEAIDEEYLDQAGKIIREGGLVAFPTETVYGLGADGLNEEAVVKIYKAKGRPSDNPLILHISSMELLYPLVEDLSDLDLKLIEKYWPGPLTLIFKKSKLVPHIITGGLDSVAIRMPSNPIALELISKANRPIAAPSANLSGRPSPTMASHVIEDMSGKIDMIIDGGKTGLGLESTVLDLSGDLATILRPGAITYEELSKDIENLSEDKSILNQGEVPKSPGQKYRHYAPRAEMVVFSGEIDDIVNAIKKEAEKYLKEGKKVGIMATSETEKSYEFGLVRVLGSRSHSESIASNLFETIREFDKLEVDIILAEAIDSDNIGRAIMNRMIKAAGGKLIKT